MTEFITDYQKNIRPAIKEAAHSMVPLFQDLHKNPELGFKEKYAQERLTRLFDEWKVPYEEFKPTGIVVKIDGQTNKSGRMVGFRTEMDALPIQELTGLPWASQKPGFMHACGHDGHMATMASFIKYIKDNNNFDGTAVMIFQPAEEGMGGARHMIESGLLEKYPIDSCYSIHNWPMLPLGQIGIHKKEVCSSTTRFYIAVQGVPAHTGRPEQGNNPMFGSAEMLLAIEEYAKSFPQNASPDEMCKLVPSAISAGNMKSLGTTPEVNKIGGTIRVYNEELLQEVQKTISDIVLEKAEARGLEASFEFEMSTPPLIANRHKVKITREVCKGLVAPKNVISNYPPSMGSDDAAEISKLVASNYIRMGGGSVGENSPYDYGLHHPSYRYNTGTIEIGVEFYARVVEAEMPMVQPDLPFKDGAPEPAAEV